MTTPPSRRKGPQGQDEPIRGVATWQTPPISPLQVLRTFLKDMSSNFYPYWPLASLVTKLDSAAAEDGIGADMRATLLDLGRELSASSRPCVTSQMIEQIALTVA